jgi:hypothetical protein
LHSLDHRRLEGGVVPFGVSLHLTDPQASVASGRAAFLNGAHMKRIAYDIAIGGFES